MKKKAVQQNEPEYWPIEYLYAGILVIAVGFFVLVGLIFHHNRNYAKDVARPLEMSLAKVGAMKLCSRSSDGRGWDSRMPWYYVIYELSGNREVVTRIVLKTLEESGYQLSDGPYPVNPRDNKFYSDKSSKRSPFSELEEGNIDLRVTVFGGHAYNGEQGYLCGVSPSDNPPKDKTIIRFTINLPEFRRQ